MDELGNVMPSPGNGRPKRARIDKEGNFVASKGIYAYNTATSPPTRFSVTEGFGGGASVESFGAVGDGTTNDTVAIQAAFDSGKSPIVFDGSKSYLVGLMTVPSGTALITNGATFEGTSTASGTAYISMDDNTSADCIRLNLATGRTTRRPIQIIGNNVFIGKIIVTSVDQQANVTSSFDAAVKIDGDHCYVNKIDVTNFDQAVQINNCNHVYVGNVHIESYVMGLRIGSTATSHVYVMSGHIHTQSPNATGAAGENGINIQETSYMYLNNMTVEDSGEHGIYCAGGLSFQQYYRMNNIQCLNTGGCGIKIRGRHVNGDTNFLYRFMSLSNILLQDCDQTSNPCLLMERVSSAIVTNLKCTSLTKATCATNGIEMSSCGNVYVVGAFIQDPGESAIALKSVNSYNDGGTVYYDITNLNFSDVWAVQSPAGFPIVSVDYSGNVSNAPNCGGNVFNLVGGGGTYGVEFINTGGFGVLSSRNFVEVKFRSNPSVGAVGGTGFDPQRVAYQNYSNSYNGYVGLDGTTGNRLPPGMTAARTANPGVYTITHNLNIVAANLGLQFIANGVEARPYISSSTADTVVVSFTDPAAALTNTAFNFLIVVDSSVRT